MFRYDWEGLEAGAVDDAIPTLKPADRGPGVPFTRCNGGTMGRDDVDAGEGEGAVDAGDMAAFFFSAACRIWSLTGREPSTHQEADKLNETNDDSL